MGNRIQAIVFDCDGTLVDSEVIGMDLMQEMALQRGVSLTREETYQQFRGISLASVIQLIKSRLGGVLATDFDEQFVAQYREESVERFRQRLRPIPGVLEFIRSLPIPFAVATNGPREKAELTLSIVGLLPYVGNRIFSAYEHGAFKPDPGLFLLAAAEMGVEPVACAAVEDSIAGIRAGLAAGMQVFSLHPSEQLDAALLAEVTSVADFAELGEYL